MVCVSYNSFCCNHVPKINGTHPLSYLWWDNVYCSSCIKRWAFVFCLKSRWQPHCCSQYVRGREKRSGRRVDWSERQMRAGALSMMFICEDVIFHCFLCLQNPLVFLLTFFVSYLYLSITYTDKSLFLSIHFSNFTKCSQLLYRH